MSSQHEMVSHFESCEDDDCEGCAESVSIGAITPSATVKLSELVAAKKEGIFSAAEVRLMYGYSEYPENQRQGILGEAEEKGEE